MRGPWNSMADLLDESIKEKYRQYFVNDPLKFMKDAIDWNAFPSLLKDIYHNDTEEGGRPNIPITTMVKILFLQSLYDLFALTSEWIATAMPIVEEIDRKQR